MVKRNNMKKGDKKLIVYADCNNKAEMISNVIGLAIEMFNASKGNWCGNWDGMQWSASYMFVNPDNLKESDSFKQIVKKEYGCHIEDMKGNIIC